MLSATRDMAGRILSYASDSAEVTKALIVDVLLHIVREAQKNLPSGRELPASIVSLFECLDRITGRSALIEWLCDVMIDTRRIIRAEWENTNPVIHRVLTRIRDHYNQPLSIKTLSSEIGINPSYLGYLFKQETGQYFSDFLNRTRIQEG